MMFLKRVIAYLFNPYSSKKSRTVRSAFAFPIFIALTTVLSAAVINSQNQSFIYIESSKTSVVAGERFQIAVYVSAHVPVNAVDIKLAFPKEQVQILGVDTGESVITLWTQEPYVEKNTVVLQGGTFRKGFKGDHLIATINAKAYTSGLATFEISDSTLLAGDGSGSAVEVSESGKESTQLYVANKDGTFYAHSVGIEGAVTVRILTDIDGDGIVSLNDISQFMSAWTRKTEVFDFSGDGQMTFRDFGIILADAFLR